MTRHRRRNPSRRPAAGGQDRSGDRLQKVLASAGLGSRRDCEELIISGRVEVDGKTVTELGSRVDPLRQEVRVDGTALPQPKRVHYLLNKPMGIVCTNDDPSGRMRAVDLIRSNERLFTIGRLDRSSEGLILVTNDGELANQLTHPRYGVEKRYLVRVVGSVNPAVLDKLQRGVHLAEGVARVADIRVRKSSSKFTDLEIVLQEGRNREIRRILARVGHKVVRLKRIAIGPLRLGELPVGESRPLTRDEIHRLQQTAKENRLKRSRPRPDQQGKPGKPARSAKHERAGGDSEPPIARPKRAVKPAGSPPAVSGPGAPIFLELDEVEVMEKPETLTPGAVIGADDDWGPPQAPPTRERGPRERSPRPSVPRGLRQSEQPDEEPERRPRSVRVGKRVGRRPARTHELEAGPPPGKTQGGRPGRPGMGARPGRSERPGMAGRAGKPARPGRPARPGARPSGRPGGPPTGSPPEGRPAGGKSSRRPFGKRRPRP